MNGILTRLIATTIFCCLLSISLEAASSEWHEAYDEAMFPSKPQALSDTGELTAIHGYISGLDIDLFRIYIPNPSRYFSATQFVPSDGDANLGPQLFLFDDEGMGIYSTTGSNGFSRGPGLFSSSPLAPTTSGYYWLGVSPSNLDPHTVPVGTLGVEYPIFWNCQSSPCEPTSHGDIYPLGDWGGTYHAIASPYVIEFTGVYFGPQSIPEPMSTALLITCLGLIGIVSAPRI